MTTVAITVAIVAIVMLIMAIGVIVKGKCLSGSCGGPKITGPDGGLVCGSCGRHEKKEPAVEGDLPPS